MKNALILLVVSISLAAPSTWAANSKFEAYTPDARLGTLCSHGAPFTYFARKGWLPDGQRGLIVEFEGGGCCFSALTCALPQYTRSVDVSFELSMLNSRGGIGSSTNTKNPVYGFDHLYVPYCTGDAHVGNKTASYGVHHFGRRNVKAALEWLKTNISVAPSVVFVTGGSAGSVASYVWAPWIFQMFPKSKHVHLGDSYAPLFGKSGYQGGLDNWDLLNAYLPSIKGIVQNKTWTPYVAARDMVATAAAFPEAQFSSYVSDSDTVEEGFYLDEGCGADGCDWHEAFRTALKMSQAAPNFASFVAAGYTHVVTESDEMYSKKAQGVAFSDWLTDMIAGRAAAKSLDCKNDGEC